MIPILLSIISGTLTGLGFSFPWSGLLLWVSFIPLFFSLRNATLKQTIIRAAVYGFFFYGVTIFWVSKVTGLGLVFLLLYLMLYPVVFCLSARCWISRPHGTIVLACLWVVLEFIKEHIWCGFSWANIGYSQYQLTPLIQIAGITSSKGISFLVIAFNVALYQLIKNIRYAKIYITAIVIAVALCLGYGMYAMQPHAGIATTKVSVIQTNIFQGLKWQESYLPLIKTALTDLGRQADKDSLVIFPEASWPEPIQQQQIGVIKQFFDQLDISGLLMGAVIQDQDQFYNTAVVVTQHPEHIALYKKIKLVPFGEYIPGRKFLSFIPVINLVGDMSRGKDFTTFKYHNKNFSVLICFEDIFPLHVRRFSQQRDFLVNITNDAWFNGEPEASQHLAIMTLRAVENHIAIVRCANTGISGWVNPQGKIYKLSSQGKIINCAGIAEYNVATTKKRSLYNRWGEWFVVVCVIVFLGLIVRYKPAKV